MKIFYAIAFVVFSAAERYIIIKLKGRRKKVGVQVTSVSVILLFLLTLVVYIFDLNISYCTLFLAALSLFLNAYVGYYLNYYSKSRVVDRYLHGYGTFALALLFYSVIILLTEKGGSKLFQSLFVLFLGIALGSIYEIIEFLSDLKQNAKMQKGLRDTNLDIIFNIIGSFAAALAAFFFMI